MEQIDMFELELDETQQLFKKFNLELSYEQVYVFNIKKCICSQNLPYDNMRAKGILLKYDALGLYVGNVWLENQQSLEQDPSDMGCYKNSIFIALKDVQKIEIMPVFDFQTGLAYRAEIYKTNPETGRPTTWVSCYFRGITHSGQIMLVTLAKPHDILILPRRDIKIFSPLSLNEMRALEQEQSEVV